MRARQASSKGPPVQRTGTHASGTAEPEASSVHDITKSAIRRGNHVANLHKETGGEIWPTPNARPPGRDLECARFVHANDLTSTQDHGKIVVLLEGQSSNTSLLRDRLRKICDWSHDFAVAPFAHSKFGDGKYVVELPK